MGRSSVPSGSSTGSHEALELRDFDATRYNGRGVLTAVHHVNTMLAKELVGCVADQQRLIDQVLCDLDGTPTKQKLGANALLGVSLAVAKACAHAYNMPLWRYLGGTMVRRLPVPMCNILNGGKHADNPLNIQEFMIIPKGAPCFSEGLRMVSEIFHSFKTILHDKGLSTNVGDEGGFAPAVHHTRHGLDLIMQAIDQSGYQPGEDVFLGLDSAATEFYDDGLYNLSGENKKFTSHEMITEYEDLIQHYPIISIEDGLAEDDWDGWTELTQRLGQKIQLVGDDLFVTDTKRLQRGIDHKVANSILIKPNQIGTLSETVDAIELAHRHGYRCVISHRSGETEDTTIADLAVAFQTGYIKTGSVSRMDRVAKYNQLLRIEASLLGQGTYY